jgi:hypothetical protein
LLAYQAIRAVCLHGRSERRLTDILPGTRGRTERRMIVHFQKAGPRHYGVLVERESGPPVFVQPAPGFDGFLPHDLLHFVAEAAWGIDGGVFGQLAAGGDPGLFLPVDEELLHTWLRNRKRRKKERPRGLRSEAIAAVLEAAWRKRTGRAPLPDHWDTVWAAARVEPDRLDAVLTEVEALARRWHALPVGGSLELEWPRPEGRRQQRHTTKRPTAPRPTARRPRGSRQPLRHR